MGGRAAEKGQNDMKLHVTYTVEKDYNYDEKEWLEFNHELTHEAFVASVKKWIEEDYARIDNRASNVLGDFTSNLIIGEVTDEQESIHN